MATPDQVEQLKALGRTLKELVETLEDPERIALALRVKQLRDLVDVIERRTLGEAARRRSGVGAAARFERQR